LRQANFNPVVQALAVTPTKTVPKDAFFQKHPDRMGGVFAYRFGALTFWNMDHEEIKAYLARVEAIASGTFHNPIESDDYQVEENKLEKPHAEFNKLVIDHITEKRAEVIALTLGQSVTMSYYEGIIASIAQSVSGLLDQMKKSGGRVKPAPRKFHSIIADAVKARNDVIGALHLLDKPDIIWDDRTMDLLYSDLRSSFDLEERFRALEYKLGAIQDTMELLIDMARDNRLFLLEASIVALIMLEIILSFIHR
jgi:uncharacterized Rmd1/YagE family protein